MPLEHQKRCNGREVGRTRKRTRGTSRALEAGSTTHAGTLGAAAGGVEAPGPHMTIVGHRGRTGEAKRREVREEKERGSEDDESLCQARQSSRRGGWER